MNRLIVQEHVGDELPVPSGLVSVESLYIRARFVPVTLHATRV